MGFLRHATYDRGIDSNPYNRALYNRMVNKLWCGNFVAIFNWIGALWEHHLTSSWRLSSSRLFNLTGRSSVGWRKGTANIFGGFPFTNSRLAKCRMSSIMKILNWRRANSFPTQVLDPPPNGIHLRKEPTKYDGNTFPKFGRKVVIF